MRTLVGNGQPGRMDKAEAKLEAHARMLYVGLGLVLFVQFAAAQGWLTLVKAH